MHWIPSLCYVLHALKCFYNSLCSTNYILLKKLRGIPFVDQMLCLMTWKLWLSALPAVSLWSGSKGWGCFWARLEYGTWKTQGRRWVALKECLRDILEDSVFRVSSRHWENGLIRQWGMKYASWVVGKVGQFKCQMWQSLKGGRGEQHSVAKRGRIRGYGRVGLKTKARWRAEGI